MAIAFGPLMDKLAVSIFEASPGFPGALIPLASQVIALAALQEDKTGAEKKAAVISAIVAGAHQPLDVELLGHLVDACVDATQAARESLLEIDKDIEKKLARKTNPEVEPVKEEDLTDQEKRLLGPDRSPLVHVPEVGKSFKSFDRTNKREPAKFDVKKCDDDKVEVKPIK